MNSPSIFARIIAAYTSRNSRRARASRQGKKFLREALLDLLEERQLLATTSFASGLLTINLDAAGEILSLTNNGTDLSLTSSAAITGAGASFTASGVTQLAVTDSGSLAGQTFNFGVGSPFSFSNGVAVSNIESVLVNGNISVSGSSSFSITASQTIQTAGSLTTAGGPLTLAATSDIVITQPILTSGGVQTLTADSDADGSGNLSLNFSITQFTDPNPNAGNQFGSNSAGAFIRQRGGHFAF